MNHTDSCSQLSGPEAGRGHGARSSRCLGFLLRAEPVSAQCGRYQRRKNPSPLLLHHCLCAVTALLQPRCFHSLKVRQTTLLKSRQKTTRTLSDFRTSCTPTNSSPCPAVMSASRVMSSLLPTTGNAVMKAPSTFRPGRLHRLRLKVLGVTIGASKICPLMPLVENTLCTPRQP